MTELQDSNVEPSLMETLEGAFDKAFSDEDLEGTEEAVEDEAEERLESDAEDAETQDSTDDGEEPEEPEKAEKPEDDEKDDGRPIPYADAPPRLSEEAKSVWADAPVQIRADVTRIVSDLEAGIEKYRDDAGKYEPFREIHQQIEANGQRVQDVIAHYTGMEQLLASDPLRGLDQICRNLGTDLATVAAQVMNRPADQQNGVINGLHAQNRELQERIQQLEQNQQQQVQGQVEAAEAQLLQDIDAFAKEHEHFEAVSGDMITLIELGKAQSLDDAYTQALRINNLHVASNANDTASDADRTAARKRRGDLSIKGSPAGGSSPREGKKRPRSASSEDSVEWALKQAGI